MLQTDGTICTEKSKAEVYSSAPSALTLNRAERYYPAATDRNRPIIDSPFKESYLEPTMHFFRCGLLRF